MLEHASPARKEGASPRPRVAAMRLLTHNMLMSPGTKNGYPLAIEAEKVETVETEFNPDFLVRMVEKLEEKQRRREYEPGFEESEAARQLARIAPYLEYRGQRVISPLGLLQGELKVMNLTERAKHSIDFAVMKRSRSLPDLRIQAYT